VLALGLARLLQTLLHEVDWGLDALDPLTCVAAAAALLAASVAASALPALRAARLDLNAALRTE
jgi:hypothetical protein